MVAPVKYIAGFCFLLLASGFSSPGQWTPDRRDGTYRNPIIFADYSDPDVIRVNDDYYMVSSSFNFTPGLPVLHSTDLVNWTIVGHVFAQLPSPIFDKPQHGYGCWAPSLRYRNGEFYVYYGDPDLGIFMSKTKNPAGVWEPLTLVKSAKGWIDPCPFWDEDGNAYLVHAWAKSRAGFNSILTVNRMSADGKSILDSGAVVFDAHANHPTMEGPKFYKRNGFYYIFAPAGGVPTGWQTVLRSRSIMGPYEDRIVLAQGSTAINGPHQGAWVETQNGESWFIHFQERGSYGRILHLQPMVWVNDWPVIGSDPDGNGIGEPVMSWKKPTSPKVSKPAIPQTSDEFNRRQLGYQWQWAANHQQGWSSLSARKGSLRLFAVAPPDSSSRLFDLPHILSQKFPAPEFSMTASLDVSGLRNGESAGLIVKGYDYSALVIERKGKNLLLREASCRDAQKKNKEAFRFEQPLSSSKLFVQAELDSAETYQLSFSLDGKTFVKIGERRKSRECAWVGATVGLFCSGPFGTKPSGHVDVDWFRVN